MRASVFAGIMLFSAGGSESRLSRVYGFAEAVAADPADGVEAGAEAKTEPGQGDNKTQVIRITLPITGPTASRLKQCVRDVLNDRGGPPKNMIFVFETNRGEEQFASRSEFGACYDLAEFLTGDELSRVRTIAYVPYRAEGHAVLVILACGQVILAPDAELGSAGIAEKRISPPMLSAYREIAQRRRVMPVEIALGMLDPARAVLQVETDVERVFVTPEGLEQLGRPVVGEPTILFPAGQLGRLTGREARALDLIDYTAADLRELLAALAIPQSEVEEEVLAGGMWRAVQVRIQGPIHARTVQRAQKMIEDALRRDVNFVFLDIDSAGGSPVDSLRLAAFLAVDLPSDRIRTVAYVPRQALSDAALIALACDHLIMHPDARLGGEGDGLPSDEELTQVRRTWSEAVAPKIERSWSLPVAMLDPDLDVFRYTRKSAPGMSEFYSQEEWQSLPNPEDWVKGEAVTIPGEPLQLTGEQAVEFGLAKETVDSFAAMKELYGLENDPALLEPTWSDMLIEGLASPGVAVALVIIGFVSLLIELQTPGIGVGAFVATVCFVLFFWSRFLGQTAEWLEIVLFLVGLMCLAVELFVLPGFGIFGLGGGALILASLVLAGQTFVWPRNSYQWTQFQQSLLVIAAAAVGTGVLASLIGRWLPHTPGIGRIVLLPPSEEEAEAMERRRSLLQVDESLVGERGTTVTPLLPGGKARLAGRLLDVLSQDGEPIDRGRDIVVTEVRGTRIIVRPLT
ncbi:MAG: hypothetical protein GYA33_13670 [Thermogutta sp.]|nr:hypothetical protein [Thermogutta sp.]